MVTTTSILDTWLKNHEEEVKIYRLLGKKWCKLYKKSPMHKKTFILYCESKKDVHPCFKLFYVDGVDAEKIAESENIDRRTVFKHIDSEMYDFGRWLDNNIHLYGIFETYLKTFGENS